MAKSATGFQFSGDQSCERTEMQRQYFGCAHRQGLVDVAIDGGAMSLQEQDPFKMILYAGGNYGWADRLRHLLPM